MALKVGELFATLGLESSTFTAGLKEAKTALERTGKDLSLLGGQMTMQLTRPLLELGNKMFGASKDYETAFAGVKKTVDATDEEYKALSDTILNMTEEIPASAVEIAGVMELGGQFTIAKDALESFARTVIAFSAAAPAMGMEDIATSFAQFRALTQITEPEIQNAASAVTELGNNMATTEAKIFGTSLRFAAAGKQAGMSAADILGLSAAVSSLGMEEQAAGSSISQFFASLSLAVAEGGASLDAFAGIAGMTGAQFADAFKNDATGAFQAFIKGLSESEDATKSLADAGITEVNMSRMLQGLAGAGDALSSALTLANSGWNENIALTAEAEKRYATTESQMQITANAADRAMINFGDNIKDAVDGVMPKLNEIMNWFNSFDESTQTGILTAFSVFAIGGPVVKAIGDTIGAIGSVKKGIEELSGLKGTILSVMNNPTVWGVAAGVGAVALLGIKLASIKSDVQIITEKAAKIELKIDEGSKNETLQAIAEVRKEIETLSGAGLADAAGTVGAVKAGYGTAEMFGKALGLESTGAQKEIAAVSAKYSALIDEANASIVDAVNAGDTAQADALAKDRSALESEWDAAVVSIMDAYTLSVSGMVDGMASQYPEAVKQISDAMEQHSALRALNEYDPTEMSDAEMRKAAQKLLGMEGMEKALAEMGQTPEGIIAMYGGLPINILDGLRESLMNSLTASLDASKESPINTILNALLSDTGTVQGLNFAVVDGALADGLALLDFKASATAAAEKGGEIGGYLTEGLGAGMLSDGDSLKTSANALRDKVVGLLETAFIIGSPSELMADRIGRYIPSGVAKGIRENTSEISTALTAMMASLNVQGVGLNFSKGLASGITSGTKWIKDAARSAALAAKTAAEKALDEHSPSRVAFKIGSFFTEGMADGIESMNRAVARASQGVAAMATRGLSYSPARVPAIAGAAGGGNVSLGIDYNRLAVALAAHPTMVNLNDKVLARATVEPNAAAEARRQARIRAGYGG